MNLQEFIEEHELDYQARYFNSWSFKRVEGIELIQEDLNSYDEGTVYTQYIFKLDEKIYEIVVGSNSWAEYEEPFTDIEVYEVKAVEKTVIGYERV